MTEQVTEQAQDPRILAQVDHITSTFRDSTDQIKIGVEYIASDAKHKDRGVAYIYAEGEILVRDKDLGRVREVLRQDSDPSQDSNPRRVITGVVLLSLDDYQLTVPDALERLDLRLGVGVATPNHVLTVAGGDGGVVGPCPATEPQEVYDGTEPLPGVSSVSDGAGVSIYIADPGLLDDAAKNHSWLKGVTGDTDPVFSPGGGTIRPYAAHGTFVAGVARCQAPAAEIHVANIFNTAGSALESDLIQKLDLALNEGYDILNLSICAPTRNGLPMLAFEVWRRRLRQYKGVVCVVAAGNDGSSRPRWPAAYPEMVAVGALADDWSTRAQFSNHGGWVDVYAPGRNLVNAYATGTYICKDPPYEGDERKFHGMARWSGTSFSTPVVSGLIAARMSRTGENGRQAAAALLAQAQSQANPGVGAILLPARGSR